MLEYRVALESWKSVCKLPYSKMKGRKVDVIVSSPRVKSVSVVDAQIIGAVWQSRFYVFGSKSASDCYYWDSGGSSGSSSTSAWLTSDRCGVFGVWDTVGSVYVCYIS